MRLLGLDPGLRTTGWGVIESVGNRLSHLGNGSVRSDGTAPMAMRLMQIHDGLRRVLESWRPDAAAVEETFVNKNPSSTLKLGQVRGVVLLVPALEGVAVHEYAPNLIKKSVVGAGHAEKAQIHAMVRVLLPGVEIEGPDAADALAVAICHAHHQATARRIGGATIGAGASGAMRP